PYRVLGHDSRLSQVIVNLLDNAISFSPPGGRVAVLARRIGPEIQIAVEDEGPGIPSENLERIFERFYTDRPQENFGQNSGLGLNISRQIVMAHGGSLYAENRPPSGMWRGKGDGKSGGARFVIRLPATCQATREACLKQARELVHGTCVALGRRGVLLRGSAGYGKSDLALRFMALPGEGALAP